MNSWKPRIMWTIIGAIFIIVALAYGGPECESLTGGKCEDGSGWDPLDKLNEIGNGTKASNQAQINYPKLSRELRWNMPDSSSNNSSLSSPLLPKANATEKIERSSIPASIEPNRSASFYEVLAPLSSVSQFDVILDVSDGAKNFIPGAVHINYKDFQNKSKLRSDAELSEILGSAGISNNSSIVIYGECQPCGGGPSVSTYVYWILRYLGHDREKIRVLDGGIVNWAASNYSLANSSLIKPKANYTIPAEDNLQKRDLLATYEEVNSGQIQIRDCRTPLNWGNGSILGSTNIPHDYLLMDGRIKDEEALQKIIGNLNRNKTVVVYSETGIKASLLWFVLEHMGYKAKLYSWQDWKENEAKVAGKN